ncbi:MAG: hypothetical protein H0V44_11335 [Planctomycetes bacterium]|nr:hypothetical protein [Planctomycetota bacterium]
MNDDQTRRRRRSLNFLPPPHFTLTPPTGPFAIPDPQAAAQESASQLRLEDIALKHWRDFFCRFREDESDDLSEYRERAAGVQQRLAQLPFGKRPDAALAADMLELLLSFDRSRFEELCYRVDTMSASCHQYAFQSQSAELARCHQIDEIQRCIEMLQYAIGSKRLLTHPERLVKTAAERLAKLLQPTDPSGAQPLQNTPTVDRSQQT